MDYDLYATKLARSLHLRFFEGVPIDQVLLKLSMSPAGKHVQRNLKKQLYEKDLPEAVKRSDPLHCDTVIAKLGLLHFLTYPTTPNPFACVLSIEQKESVCAYFFELWLMSRDIDDPNILRLK